MGLPQLAIRKNADLRHFNLASIFRLDSSVHTFIQLTYKTQNRAEAVGNVIGCANIVTIHSEVVNTLCTKFCSYHIDVEIFHKVDEMKLTLW